MAMAETIALDGARKQRGDLTRSRIRWMIDAARWASRPALPMTSSTIGSEGASAWDMRRVAACR